MSNNPPFRPWGEAQWALGLSSCRKWRFLGCLAAEDRSVAGLQLLEKYGNLESAEMIRVVDTDPADIAAEDLAIQRHIDVCDQLGLSFGRSEAQLEAALQNSYWKQKFAFETGTSFCLDISSFPKRFFFSAIKAAILSPSVRDFFIVYSKPEYYPENSLSSNPRDWSTISGFDCDDPDAQAEALSHLIVGAGFAAGGLHDHLVGRSGDLDVDVLIPFPAEPWASVRRAWDSARVIEEALGADSDKGSLQVKPSFLRVGAFDTSSAFDRLLNLTGNGQSPAALAPLGPKPHSVAMCLLAAQTGCHPVYYAQPRTYAVNYSTGCETVYGYWIKHQGKNLYSVGES